MRGWIVYVAPVMYSYYLQVEACQPPCKPCTLILLLQVFAQRWPAAWRGRSGSGGGSSGGSYSSIAGGCCLCSSSCCCCTIPRWQHGGTPSSGLLQKAHAAQQTHALQARNIWR